MREGEKWYIRLIPASSILKGLERDILNCNLWRSSISYIHPLESLWTYTSDSYLLLVYGRVLKRTQNNATNEKGPLNILINERLCEEIHWTQTCYLFTGWVHKGHETLRPMQKLYFIYHPIKEDVKLWIRLIPAIFILEEFKRDTKLCNQ